MVPGMSKALKGIDVDDNAFVGIEHHSIDDPSERAEPRHLKAAAAAASPKVAGEAWKK